MRADYTPEQMIRDAWVLCIASMVSSGITLLFVMWALAASGEFEANKDPITFSLGLLQTIIALGAFAGFWLIRGVAANKAKDVAEEEANKIADAVVKSHLEKNLEEDINKAIATVLNGSDGPMLLGKAISDPSIIALIAAEISKFGLLTTPSTSSGSGSAPSSAPITNPGKSGGIPKQNLNELHSDFWFGIAEEDKRRFLKPYEEPPFEE